jgi:hypothetical protein
MATLFGLVKAGAAAMGAVFSGAKPAIEVTQQVGRHFLRDSYWVRLVDPPSHAPIRIICEERAQCYDIAKGTLKEAFNLDGGAHNVLVYRDIEAFLAKVPPLMPDVSALKFRETNTAENPFAVQIKKAAEQDAQGVVPVTASSIPLIVNAEVKPNAGKDEQVDSGKQEEK